MTTVQEDRESMQIRVEKVLDEAPASALAAMPGVGPLITEFKDALALTRVSSQIQSTDITGYAEVKEQKKVLTVTDTMAVCKSVKGFAIATNNTVLFNEMNLSRSGLMSLADARLVDVAKNVITIVTPFLASLGPYGVTALTLTDLDATIDAYDTVMPEPRENIILRTNATESIAFNLTRSDAAAAKIDVMMDMLETSHPDFYKLYKKSRKVISSGSRILSLRIILKDAAGMPLEKVKITFAGLTLVKKTSAKGKCQVAHMKEGIYSLTCKRTDLKDLVLKVAIRKDMRTDVEVVMERLVLEG